MPRGRPDPFSQVADGGRVHLTPPLQILEQDRSQLDEPQRRLAPGDDGVHARTVAVMRADATVAVTVQGGRIAAGPAVSLTGDEIDERCFLGLLHGLPLSVAGGGNGAWAGRAGGSSGPERRVLAQYTGPNPYRQEGNQPRISLPGRTFRFRRPRTRRRRESSTQGRRVRGRSPRSGRSGRPRSDWSALANPRQ